MLAILFRILRTGLLLIAIGALLMTQPWQYLPSAWKPWAPLSLDDPPTSVTRMKLARLRDSPAQCLALLASSPEAVVDYNVLADYTPIENCPLINVVRVHSTGVKFNSPFTVSCPLLVRWLMFERQQLQPLALEHQGSPLIGVDHLGTFACRNVYGREAGRRSQHASASAFDVATFRFADGEVVSVLDDWDNDSADTQSAFLKAAHRSACAYFGSVLGPEYNAPHANHFHLDTSTFNLCR